MKSEQYLVYTDIVKTPRATVEAFSNLSVATVAEAQDCVGVLSPDIRPIYRPAKIAGTAVTCEVPPGDNWMIHVAVEQCAAGDILVVAPIEPCDAGYFGDLLATSLQSRGVYGLIIDAGVRDIATLTAMQFPVWSRTVHASGTVKEGLCNINVPIKCAGQLVPPGDMVIADDDGVVVVPRQSAEEVLEKAVEREANEEKKRKRLAEGELTLSMYGMRDLLEKKGLKYRSAQDGD